jgi:hypothetical protein
MYIDNVKSELCKDKTKDTGAILNIYPKDNDKTYSKLNIEKLKEHLLKTFLFELIMNRDKLPKIIFEEKHVEKGKELNSKELFITADDIPEIDKNGEELKVKYKKIIEKDIVDVDREETLYLYSLKSNNINENQIIFSSAGREVLRQPIDLIKDKDSIESNRYMIIVKGDVLDDSTHIDNERGVFKFKTMKDLKALSKSDQRDFVLDTQEFFVIDGLHKEISKKIATWYPEIKEKMEEKDVLAEEIKDKFLISDEIFDKVKDKLSIEASNEDILNTYYTEANKNVAKNDIKVEEAIEEIKSIDFSKEEDRAKFEDLTKTVVETIPLQNRTALTQYVARRKMILEMFEALLDKKMEYEVQEKHVHNLIMQQHSKNTEESSLWIINEDFIYFDGLSESRLCDLEINNKKVFKSSFTEEEEKILHAYGRKREDKRTDVMLFPEENKCIIIEFKKPDIDTSEHLNQINNYASLIMNYSNEEFKFEKFYGYLVGENFSNKDIIRHDSDYKESYSGNYLFRPEKRVVGENGRRDGAIYTEILRYSALLDRAKLRNKIFIDKLGIKSK